MLRLTLTLVASLAACHAAVAADHAASSSASNAGSVAQTGSITFHGSHQSDRVATTPPVYVAPSMMAPGTCGMSDTAAVTVTGFGIGGSRSHESDYCNARQDAGVAWNLGYKDVAALRFFCFGEDENRQAYLAAGYQCPDNKAPMRAVAGYTGNDPIVIARLSDG